jgi:hypothetical protein
MIKIIDKQIRNISYSVLIEDQIFNNINEIGKMLKKCKCIFNHKDSCPGSRMVLIETDILRPGEAEDDDDRIIIRPTETTLRDYYRTWNKLIKKSNSSWVKTNPICRRDEFFASFINSHLKNCEFTDSSYSEVKNNISKITLCIFFY